MTGRRSDLDALAARVRATAHAAELDPRAREPYFEALVALTEALLYHHELADAAAVAEEAIEVISAIIVDGQRDRSVGLGVALRLRGDALLELDEAEAALGCYAQAVRLLADLAQLAHAQPAEPGPDSAADPTGAAPTELALTLLRYGDGLRRIGHGEEALEILDRALLVIRELSVGPGGDPSLVPALVRAQIARGRALAELGSPDEALAAIDQAVSVGQELAAGAPDLHTLVHAEALDALAGLLRALGRPDQAIAPAEQALTAVTGLARDDGVGHLYPLARLTHNLARCCQQAERFDRAAALFEQAVEAFALLAEARPAAHQASYVEVLSHHALARAQAGELERAQAIATATVALAEAEPGWHLLPLIIGTRQFLADLAVDLGAPADAVAQLDAALRLLQRADERGLPGIEEARARIAGERDRLDREPGA